MIYELRIYTCTPGRIPDVLQFFHKNTLPAWERNGIEQLGFWTTQIGGSSLEIVYMLKWDSLADRETKWAAFVSDAEFLEARRAGDANGPIVQSVSNRILSPTAFSKAI